MLADYRKLAAWHDQIVDFEDSIGEGLLVGRLGRWLRERGLSDRGWQIYLFYGDAVLDAIGEPWIVENQPADNIKNTIDFLNLVAACDMRVLMLPPRALVTSIAQWNIPERRIDVIPVNFFRSLWEACMASEYKQPAKQVAMAQFIKKAMLPLTHWYFSTGEHLKPKANERLLTGWIALRSMYSVWRKDLALQNEEQNPAPPEWPPLIEAFESNGLKFISLASSAALRLEGNAMQHCIAEHIPRFRTEMVRAYSIRDGNSGNRLATLTVKESVPRHWVIDDLQGKQNSAVSDQVRQAANELLHAYEANYIRRM